MLFLQKKGTGITGFFLLAWMEMISSATFDALPVRILYGKSVFQASKGVDPFMDLKRLGVIGVGHLGQHHARVYTELLGTQLSV
jgi:hypothetical protein